ncbi:MAG: c-type cytochrome [Thiotrichales bacterium]|nr:MAG: c-type cytochrome [Thiotrichales bacterium]
MSSSNLLKPAMVVLLAFIPVAAIADADKETERLYAETCSVCHGEKGDGNSHAAAGLRPPPKDFTTSEAKQVLTREYMVHIIRDGKPGTAMMGFASQLTEQQISNLSDYIRTRFMKDTTQTTEAGTKRTTGVGIVGESGSTGKSIYALTCSVCHGEDGSGALWGKTSLNPPPVNFRLQDRIRDLPRARMIYSVTHGRPGTAMTAFDSQLDAEEIASVVDYIREAFMIEAASATTASAQAPAASTVGMAVLHDSMKESDTQQKKTDTALFDQPISDDLTGDATNGATYYMQNCTACHGVEGKGDGPRAYFIYPRPRNFQHPASKARFNRPELFSAIKKGVIGREMPAWEKVMSDQQIADITEYVFQTFINQP